MQFDIDYCNLILILKSDNIIINIILIILFQLYYTLYIYNHGYQNEYQITRRKYISTSILKDISKTNELKYHIPYKIYILEF